VVVAALCIVLPLFLGTIMNELLANVGLFLLLALGLNIVVGLAGILDLGYVAFFAVGGYTTAVLTSADSPFFAPELHFGITLVIVVVIAGITGLVIGAPVIRMRGDYLAIVTLGFGEIIRLLFMSDWLKPYFGGAQGITNVPGVDLGFATIKGTDPRSVFYLVLVFCALAIYISWRLQVSRLGRAWMAIREDEKVAEAMGINTVNTKLLAFVVGAILASFSGAILVAKVGSVFPNSFMILVSIIILVVVIVGGMGNILGVLVGSFVLIGVLGGPRQPGLLQEFQTFKLLIYGALLVFMMLKRPEGLVPSARRSQELHQEEFLQDVWLKGEDREAEEASEHAAETGPAGDEPPT
jgi:branched-chain amino acid transport system permease protein